MSRLWIVVSEGAGIEDAEAFGPFTSAALAQKLVDEHDEEGVRTAYPLMVIEIYPARELMKQIRDERAINEKGFP